MAGGSDRSDGNKSSSRRCAFCGLNLHNQAAVAYSSPSVENEGSSSKIKPLRWRFLSNKAPRSKLMCTGCAEKRQKPMQHQSSDPQRNESTDQDKRSRPLELEALQNSREKARAHSAATPEEQEEPRKSAKQSLLNRMPSVSWYRPSSSIIASEARSSATLERSSTRLSVENTRRSRAQTDERLSSTADILGMSKSLDLPPNYFEMSSASPSITTKSGESADRHRPKITATRPEPRTRLDTSNSIGSWSSSALQRSTIGAAPDRSTRSDDGHNDRHNRVKRSHTDHRLNPTAGAYRSLELPNNYFTSPTFSATSAPEMQLSELSPLETPPQKPQPKRQETEEERQRRRSASYARMLTRMKRHYEAVQVNGSHAHPATAPPRRQRAVRRAKSVASHHFRADLANDSHVETALVVTDLVSADPFKNDPVNSKAADLTVDLAYLNVYKDAR